MESLRVILFNQWQEKFIRRSCGSQADNIYDPPPPARHIIDKFLSHIENVERNIVQDRNLGGNPVDLVGKVVDIAHSDGNTYRTIIHDFNQNSHLGGEGEVALLSAAVLTAHGDVHDRRGSQGSFGRVRVFHRCG